MTAGPQFNLNMRAALIFSVSLALATGLDIDWKVTGEAIVTCVPIGETITFHWDDGENVVELFENMADWTNCVVPEGATEPEKGPWSVTMDEPVMWHFISGVEDHCSQGNLKAMITASDSC